MNFKQYMINKIEESKGLEELNEVKFSEKNLAKVVKLYSNIMGKQMNGKFMPIGTEEYKRKTGPGKGFRVMNNNGEQLRFNWDQKLAKKAKFDLTSIDYWDKGNTNFQKPSRTITFDSNLNVLQVLSKVVEALKTGVINEAEAIVDDINEMIFEARSAKEKKQWLSDNDIPTFYSSPSKSAGLKKILDKKGLTEQMQIFLGQPETNTFEDGLQKVEKAFNSKNVYADPDLVFQDIEDLTGLVASGKWRTLIVCGMGGVNRKDLLAA